MMSSHAQITTNRFNSCNLRGLDEYANVCMNTQSTSILIHLFPFQSVAINQPGTIRENDEFILSCVARGSPTMTFRWFKNGILINATSTR